MKKVYICAPLGGDVKGNLEKAIQYTRYALESGVAPVVSHFYALCLNDDVKEERKLGMDAGIELLKDCDEIWVFGDKITSGMSKEIEIAEFLNIPRWNVGEKQTGGEDNNEKENVGDLTDDHDSGWVNSFSGVS